MARATLPTILFLAEAFPFDLAGGSQQRWASTILTLTRTARVQLLCFQNLPKDRTETDRALNRFAQQLPMEIRKQFLDRINYDCVFEPKIDLPPGKRLVEWLKSFWTQQPFLVWQYQSQVFQEKLNELLTQKPKVIHLGHLRLAQFLPSQWLQPTINKKTRPRLIYEAQNVEWQLVKTQADYLPKLGRWHWWWQREISLTQNYETKVICGVGHVFALSEADVAALKTLLPTTQKSNFVTVLPVFYPPIPGTPPPSLTFKTSSQPKLLFVGNLEWLPNADAMRWFLTEIWPSFAQQFTTATLTIIGNPCSYLSLTPTVAAERVQFLGFVANIDKILTPNTIFILPFRMGGGVRFKALTAAWTGSTIVSTPLGVQGLGMVSEKNCLIGETASHFEHQLTRVAYDSKLRIKLSKAAQNYVLKHHRHTTPKNFWRHYWGKTGLISATKA